VPDDKRGFPRLDILGTLPGEVSVLAPITFRDISRKGVLGECGFPLVIGSAHDMRLHLGDQAVVVRARVVHCRVGDLGHELVRYIAGLEFIDLAPHASAAIDAYIERVRRQRGSTPGAPPSTSP
jgi:hypothetical protein